MRNRSYFSVRTGKNPLSKAIDLDTLKVLFLAAYNELLRRDYFQEFYGYNCVDAGPKTGLAGDDIEAFFLRKLRKSLAPIELMIRGYSETDLFDVIELLHDMCSKGVDGYEHTYSECGWHYSKFDAAAGQQEFRDEVNPLLRDYSTGYRVVIGR